MINAGFHAESKYGNENSEFRLISFKKFENSLGPVELHCDIVAWRPG